MTDVADARRRSVTQADAEAMRVASAGLSVWIGPYGLLDRVPGLGSAAAGLPPQATPNRDRILSLTPTFENMWSAALYKAISKQAALGFRIEDDTDSSRKVKAAQELLVGYDGAYVSGLQRGLQDYLTTELGQVVEIARASSARGSRIVGLFHLDALRCLRTGDPERPIVYQDLRGGWHVLRDYQVMVLTDQPSPRVEHRGMGYCAADRAWNTIIKLAAIEVYFREKITGERNLAIHIVNGISDEQLRSALASSEEARNARGFVLYKGSTIVPMMVKDAAPSIVTIPLAEVPDGFDVETERRDAYLRYANSIGVAVQDIQPLAGQGLGTGAQTVVLDEAAEGQGLAAWRKAWEHAITHLVLPSTTTFYLATNDYRDQKQRADVQKARGDWVASLSAAGIVSPQQALNILVDAGDIDPAYLPQDATAGGQATDNDKVLSPEELQRAAIAQEAQTLVQSAPVVPATKEAVDVAALVAEALDDRRAWDWARRALEDTDEPA